MAETYLSNRRRCGASRKTSEDGYILVAVIFMMAIMVIAMTVAAPKIAQSIQRDREVETMQRGKQYARAVKMYYKQFNAYPPNVDALVKTNEIRFLRRKYIDPTTGKDEWKVVRYGMQKTQTLGFFGQPIGGAAGGAAVGGTGLSGSGTNGSNGSGSGIGGVTFGGSSSSTASSGIFSSNNQSGSTDTSAGTTAPSGGADSSSGQTDGSTSGSGSAAGSGTNGTNGSSGAAGTSGASGTSGSTTGFGNGQTMGGVGIMGFSPNSPKQSILVYKKKNHYNEWEFIYDPLAEQMMEGGIGGGNTGAIGTPIGGANGVSPVGASNGFSLSNGTSGSANSGSGSSNAGPGNSNGNSGNGNSNSGNGNSGSGNNGSGNNGSSTTPDPAPPEQ